MSKITQLSDVELDAVTGGFLNNIGINFGAMLNESVTEQESTNVALFSVQAASGNQSANTVQVNKNG